MCNYIKLSFVQQPITYFGYFHCGKALKINYSVEKIYLHQDSRWMLPAVNRARYFNRATNIYSETYLIYQNVT